MSLGCITVIEMLAIAQTLPAYGAGGEAKLERRSAGGSGNRAGNVSFMNCTSPLDLELLTENPLDDSSKFEFSYGANQTIDGITQTCWHFDVEVPGYGQFNRMAWLYTTDETKHADTCFVYFEVIPQAQLTPVSMSPYAIHPDLLLTLVKRAPLLIILVASGLDPAAVQKDLHNEWMAYPTKNEPAFADPPYSLYHSDDWYTWDGTVAPILTADYLIRVMTMARQHVPLSSVVLMGYSSAAEMVSRAIESFPTMHTLNGDAFPLVRAGALIGGGSLYCYAYGNLSNWGNPPPAFLPCASSDPVKTGCCPVRATEPSYMNGTRSYADHPPVLLIQSERDFIADSGASINYYDTMKAHDNARACIIRIDDYWHGIRLSNRYLLGLLASWMIANTPPTPPFPPEPPSPPPLPPPLFLRRRLRRRRRAMTRFSSLLPGRRPIVQRLL